MNQTTKSLIPFAAALLTSLPGLADTRRVPADHATIQAALDAALAGDTVLVAAGEYLITEPLSFGGKGVALRSADGPSATVIRMASAPADPRRGSVIIFEQNEPEEAVVEGFTLTGGQGSKIGDFSANWGGGAIFCLGNSHPTVTGCTITGNRGTNGGGVMTDVGASITIASCVIQGNNADTIGGGILWLEPGGKPILRNSTIAGNAATSGGGLFAQIGASPQITDCVVSGNLANGLGGGLCCLVGSSPRLERCTFLGNSASEGGALSLETASDAPVLINCIIAGNLAMHGSGIAINGPSMPGLMNCTVTENIGFVDAAAVSCRDPGAEPRIVNSIVWGNSLDQLCGMVSFTIASGQQPFVKTGTYDFERFQDVMVAGVPHRMPDFVLDPGDYTLKEGSAAIDAGTSAGAPATDVRGQARPCGKAIDAGAYEFCDAGPGETFRRGDSNGDGQANMSDAIRTLEFLFWGGSRLACDKAADTNDSGGVDISDPSYLLNHLFLGGPPLPPPAAACGSDPTPDALSCESYASCQGG